MFSVILVVLLSTWRFFYRQVPNLIYNEARPVAGCQLVLTLGSTAFAIYRTSTSAIFGLRIRALYTSNRMVLSIFFCLWIVNAGLSTLSLFELKTSAIHPTGYCAHLRAPYWVFVLMPLSDSLFDLAVCTAVTYRIGKVRSLNPEIKRQGWRRWLSNDSNYGSILINRFLRDSQIYFRYACWLKCLILTNIFLLPVLLHASKSLKYSSSYSVLLVRL